MINENQEIKKGGLKMFKKSLRPVAILVTIAFIMLPAKGFSLPEGGTVVDGSATITQPDAQTMNINQSSDRAIIEYNSFSIGEPETVQFFQPNSGSIALNRVIGVDPSSILGKLLANGRIFLINPNGIIFGAGSKVDTAGMVASTLDIVNSDFLAGRYIFFGPGGSVVNHGLISAPGGYVSLLGSTIENNGIIEADLGSVINLNVIAISLGLDRVEYEPEQFPGLVYRIKDPKIVALLFSSGKIILTGGKNLEDIKKGLDFLEQKLESIM